METTCPICDNENDAILGILGNRIHVRCRCCGATYSHVATSEELVLIAAINDEDEEEEEEEEEEDE